MAPRLVAGAQPELPRAEARPGRSAPTCPTGAPSSPTERGRGCRGRGRRHREPPRPAAPLDLAQTRAAAVIAAIGPDDWDRPTPCSAWSVRDIVNKVVASTWTFTASPGGSDPSRRGTSWTRPRCSATTPSARSSMPRPRAVQAWRAPGALDGEAPSTVGDFPAKAVLNARIFDTTILSWDLATACGLQHGIDDEQAAYVLRVARALVPNVRAVNPGALPRPRGAGRGDTARRPDDRRHRPRPGMATALLIGRVRLGWPPG